MSRGRFDVWAPRPSRVRLSIGDQVVAMRPLGDGWWTPEGEVPDGPVDYGYLLDTEETVRPDPRSRRQPDGVHGRSRTDDPTAFAWSDADWPGRSLAGSTIYELHVGTFTPEGTLEAVLGKLDHLVSLGVGFVELLPVNAFNGTWNWGYDGVLWSAVHEPYGGPEGYRRLVDGCHAAGLGVIQDVVHNHLGPSGNYLPLFGPYLKDDARNTWGDVVNLDGEGSHEVRRLIIDNALMWLEDFHVDGLRLDAVHALVDSSPVHLLQELATEVDALSTRLSRPLTLIAESDLNDPVMITPPPDGYGLDAQWSDDFHHAVHVALTGETDGYYADFADDEALTKVLNRGFFHDGTFSSFRDRLHGKPIDTASTPAWRLVTAIQNHDQVGNRAQGDRLSDGLDEDRLICGAMLLLTAPFTPMLFQGEEWATSSPFAFFTSHPEPELGEAVAAGRIEEFARMGWDPDQVPNPQDRETFARSRLDWSELSAQPHARVLAAYQQLSALRAARPELTDPAFGTATFDPGTRLLTLDRGSLQVVTNLGADAVTIPRDDAAEILFATGPDVLASTGTLQLPPSSGAVLARA